MVGKIASRSAIALLGAAAGCLLAFSSAAKATGGNDDAIPTCSGVCTDAAATCCDDKYPHDRASCMACCANVFTATQSPGCDQPTKAQDCYTACPPIGG
jgi:hypothetical protein